MSKKLKSKRNIVWSKAQTMETLGSEFIRFIESHPPTRLNRNLRSMLLEYLMNDASLENDWIKDLLFDLEGLFRLLDSAEEAAKVKEKI